MQNALAETKTKPFLWHAAALEDVVKKLDARPQKGLKTDEVLRRQKTWGKNILPKGRTVGPLRMLFRQFTSPLVYILLIAALLTYLIKEYSDMIVILIVVGLNAAIGFFQEYRASKIFEKLKAIVRVETLVLRAGKLTTANSEELVPGDLIILKGGNKVPADARLILAENLEANEALLTGESRPVKKTVGESAKKAVLGDQTNMVFMGTTLERGEGRGVVVATGARTEIGKISLLAQTPQEEPSPLQLRMQKLAKLLTEIFVAIALAIFLIGLAKGDPVLEMIKTTIAVAVAAIPEGLPAAISIILAVASKKILQRKGLVMKLVAAETLGSTSVICTDKTGTLTYGEMKVEKLVADMPPEARLAMALANEAVLEEKNGKLIAKGEATDRAKLEECLANSPESLEEILQKWPRRAFVPFDPSYKFIASFHDSPDGLKIFVSGAPEAILARSALSAKAKGDIQKSYENLADLGFRMIALAQKKLGKAAGMLQSEMQTLVKMVDELQYLGLAAIRDPIRADVKETLRLTRRAGVKVVMITGDHLLTASAIGAELGFRADSEQKTIITGEELDQMSDEELDDVLGNLEILARATPIHKMRLIDRWQKRGAVVAMTGDGVNDAPALKAADIGVAVGSGTDVSKEASDLILLNDSFSTITAAIEEGRTGFANIRKATLVVLSNAFTEIILITSSLLLGTPFPITAVQILWVNIAEDSLPVLALAFEPSEKGVMEQKPLSPKEPILDREAKFIIFTVSIISDLLLVGVFMYLLKILNWDLLHIRSLIFVAAATPTLLNVFAFKSLKEPITRIKLFNNPALLLAVAFGFILTISALYLPMLNRFLGTAPLSLGPLLFALLLFPGIKLFLVELTKKRYREKPSDIT